jgi:putative transposase
MTKCAGKAGVIDLKGLLARDEDFVRAAVEALVQAALEAEMTEAIGAGKGERTETRLSYRSGYYGRSLITRVGTLELRVPQDRLGRFSTELFERYQRSEKALVGTLAEMYVQGVSTRKVKGNRGIVRAQLLGLGDQRDQQVPRREPARLCRAAAR